MASQGDTEHLIDPGYQDDDSADQSISNNLTNDANSEITIPHETVDGNSVIFTSQTAALFITVNVTIGAGILALPASVNAAGLIPSMIIQLIFLILVIVTVIISTELTVKTNVNSYHQVIKARCHRYLYIYTQVSLLLIVYGTTVAYIVIIGDQAEKLFSLLDKETFCKGNPPWYMTRRFIMTIATSVFIKPLCCAKTVDFLKYGSFLGVASLGSIILMVIREFFRIEHISDKVNYFPEKFTDIAKILPVYCMAYQCHLSWVPTAATIRKEEKYTTYKTVTLSMVLVAIIYSTVSILAVLIFGSSLQDDLTQSFTNPDEIVLATIALVAVKSIVTLPPVFLPARLSLIDILKSNSRRYANWSERVQRCSVTLVTITSALMLAILVPTIKTVVDILGCLSVMFIFTLPALAYLHQIDENRLSKQRAQGLDANIPLQYSLKDKIKIGLSYFLIVFGVVMMVVVLDKAIEDAIQNKHKLNLC